MGSSESDGPASTRRRLHAAGAARQHHRVGIDRGRALERAHRHLPAAGQHRGSSQRLARRAERQHVDPGRPRVGRRRPVGPSDASPCSVNLFDLTGCPANVWDSSRDPTRSMLSWTDEVSTVSGPVTVTTNVSYHFTPVGDGLFDLVRIECQSTEGGPWTCEVNTVLHDLPGPPPPRFVRARRHGSVVGAPGERPTSSGHGRAGRHDRDLRRTTRTPTASSSPSTAEATPPAGVAASTRSASPPAARPATHSRSPAWRTRRRSRRRRAGAADRSRSSSTSRTRSATPTSSTSGTPSRRSSRRSPARRSRSRSCASTPGRASSATPRRGRSTTT